MRVTLHFKAGGVLQAERVARIIHDAQLTSAAGAAPAEGSVLLYNMDCIESIEIEPEDAYGEDEDDPA